MNLTFSNNFLCLAPLFELKMNSKSGLVVKTIFQSLKRENILPNFNNSLIKITIEGLFGGISYIKGPNSNKTKDNLDDALLQIIQ